MECLTQHHQGLGNWLNQMQADICCFQEVKIKESDMRNDGRKYGALMDGWESFHCFNSGKGGQRLGLNGVSTYVREGLTLAANNAPLESEELDSEGRCLMTDHGSFVVFNCYVPNGGDGSRVPFKQRWLRALRRAMQGQRRRGKQVLLVGDMNMKARPEDVHYSHCTVHVESFVATVKARNAEAHRAGAAKGDASVLEVNPMVLDFARTLEKIWPRLREALLAKEEHTLAYPNAKNEMVDKWRVVARHLRSKDTQGEPKEVLLGKPMWSEQSARDSWNVRGRGVLGDGTIVYGGHRDVMATARDASEGGKRFGSSSSQSPASFVLSDPDSLDMDELVEALEKLADVPKVERKTQRAVAAFIASSADHCKSTNGLVAFDDRTVATSSNTSSSNTSSTTTWSTDSSLAQPDAFVTVPVFVEVDGMVDAFAHFHGAAAGRATCWVQQTNNRYANLGGRIDYTLVDRKFFDAYCADAHTGAAASLDCGEALENEPRHSPATGGGSTDDSASGLVPAGAPGAGASSRSPAAPDPNSFEAALLACTLSHYFKPVPMTGGGMADSPQWCYDHHWRRLRLLGGPCTGHVYTPPQYSDHIAVSLVFKRSALDDARTARTSPGGSGTSSSTATAATSRAAHASSREETRGNFSFKFDEKTRKCMPHAAQRSITSFFKKGSTMPPSKDRNHQSNKRPANTSFSKSTKVVKQGLGLYFAAKKK